VIVSLVCAGVFSLGLYGVISRRDVIGVLVSLEVMLGAANLQLVALARSVSAGAAGALPEAAALLVMVLAAGEAAVGLALLLAMWRRSRRTRFEQLAELEG
jgi:NADH:ubiquinone oxidoreductase subunit K